MILLVIAAVVASVLIFGIVVMLRALEVARAFDNPKVFRLRFSQDTDVQSVTVFLAGLSAVRPPRHRQWLLAPTVIFETHAEAGVIEHYLIVPRLLIGAVVSQMRAALPSLRLEQIEAVPEPGVTLGRELSTSSATRPLRTDRTEATSSALLATLQPLREGERVVIQWLVTPTSVPKPPRLPGKTDEQSVTTVAAPADGYELLPHTEALKAERLKQAEPLFACAGRIGVVTSASKRRAYYLLGRVRSAYHLLSAPGVELRPRRIVSASQAADRLNRRAVPLLEWPGILNAAELAGVLGWPLGASASPGVAAGAARQLPPSVDIPREGCVIGMSTYPGTDRSIAISEADRRLHLSVVGGTGSGKSTLLTSLITQDMQAGRGVIVIEPKDLVTDCLKRVPENRIKDVIVLDPSDSESVVGLNLLDTSNASAELVAENVVHIFLQIFGSTLVGPRSEDLLRAALLTGMTNPDFTLVDLPRLISDSEWRKPFVAAVQDDHIGLAAFWDAFESLKPNDQAQVISPIQNKLRQVTVRKTVRYCVGQSHPKLNLKEALDSGKLLFVPLQKGRLGDTTASFMGAMVLAQIWQTIQARTAIPEEERRQVHLYIDEAANYLKLPTSVGDLLAQARSLRLAVTLAFQHTGQLTEELKQDLEVNARSKIVFQLNAKDSRIYEKEFKPYLTAEDLKSLGTYEIVAALAARQRVAPPVTARTLPPPPETHRAKSALAWSRQHYGRKRSEVEAEINERHHMAKATPAIGRRPRRAS